MQEMGKMGTKTIHDGAQKLKISSNLKFKTNDCFDILAECNCSILNVNLSTA